MPYRTDLLIVSGLFLMKRRSVFGKVEMML
jgi:hypothetical protein